MSGVSDRLRRQRRWARPIVTDFFILGFLLLFGVLFAGWSDAAWSDLEEQMPAGGWHDAAGLPRAAFGMMAVACVLSMAASSYAIFHGNRLPARGAGLALLACTWAMIGVMIPMYVAFVAAEAWMVAEYAGQYDTENVVARLTVASAFVAGSYAFLTGLVLNILRSIYALDAGRRLEDGR